MPETKPATKSIASPRTKPVASPRTKPVASPRTKPVAKPVKNLAEEPASKPVPKNTRIVSGVDFDLLQSTWGYMVGIKECGLLENDLKSAKGAKN
jgi:outer membrane biosynthesis protein TonB